jgi:hypothetical protein
MFFMIIKELVSFLFEIVFSYKLSEIVQLFYVLVFVPNLNLFLIIWQQFIENFLINDVLSGLIGQLVIKCHIFHESLVDLRLAKLELGLQLHLVKFQVDNAKNVCLGV